MKWLTDNKGTRKRHETVQNLENEKVVSTILIQTQKQKKIVL